MASSTLRCLPGDIPPTTLLTLPNEMLEEILLCLSDAGDLVRASMSRVSIRRLVTNHRFLRRFRTRYPPSLLGIVSPLPRPRWDRPLLQLAQPPHPSAAAAAAFSGLDDAAAADFSCAFLPNPARWRRRDLRDGRALFSGVPEGTNFDCHVFVRDLAVCDPLSRRYILLPPIPDDLAALVQPPDVLRFEPFLAPPAAEDEDGMSFKVICLVQCKTKLVLLIFSSGSGAEQWRAVTFDNWISLLTGSGNQPESYRRSVIRHYAHGYFCWVLSPASKLLMLDTRSMGFSVVDLPDGTGENEAQVAILEAANGRIKMFINEHFTTELRYYVLQNDGVGANQWLSEATFNLPVNNGGYIFMGVAGGYLLLQGLGEDDQYPFHLVSLNLKTLQLELFLASKRNNKGAHLFAGFPPSLSLPTLRHDI
ncbi:uncharacterized protein LOC119362578 [Triticum dicoccoides]|uniref:uncharacterized protein LOC119362578 n=1 Tax=Triticum dicoccoides TaxID=85692 RepID=UPI00188E9D54|nr:uncharacterized protein LOC119362578 [Triticum dicoccoides]